MNSRGQSVGRDISESHRDQRDAALFRERLQTQLDDLSDLLAQPEFGVGPQSIGAELELYIIDAEGNPSHINQRLLEAAADPQLTLELNKYNLEYNLTPHLLAESAFRATEQEMLKKVHQLDRCAAAADARIVPIGILPTLTMDDLTEACITPKERYYALLGELVRLRGGQFEIDIDGAEPLKMKVDNITLEGANTSFQVHQRVAPEDYANRFNAIQLATPLALAIGANSPGLFGHQLWDETRIPLFKQSIDTRHVDPYGWHEPARVSFGHGWCRGDPHELFEQMVRLYSPLLPVCEPSSERAGAAEAPELAELRLHLSTVWLWNRPVYDHVAGGHLRIEMRAMPAGPTAIDMVAGAAFLIGVSTSLADEMESLLPAIPFHYAEYNFYRAAQYGLSSRLVWPRRGQYGLEEASVVDVIAQLLPSADDGLAALGVSQSERDRYLGVIERRLAARMNGADWQRQCLGQLMGKRYSKTRALKSMLERYRELSASNTPVAEWPLPNHQS
ncbi:glutamate-cysteine ligase, family 2 [Luminiphilus syltensis NOR5-1B]|uniref:Glutamate-cysteine ligase, family 2 n=1 Tax=Luminiphilus syltensis NOR5-1B TaxID=565045 RepID=B8KSF5_9GAMM|nr:glutamate--cysteine ligase [Luminiphilus syltensis]EED34479.1 glutamate-cysteine ligase, family 2 [Luminiphilus syltensis NOR5-1B]